MINTKTKQKLLDELSKLGNIFLSCSRIGVSRAQYYRWIKSDKKFRKKAKEAVRIGRKNISDVAEHALLKNVNNGNQKAIEYALGHNSKRYKSMPSGFVQECVLPPVKIEIVKPKERPILDNDKTT